MHLIGPERLVVGDIVDADRFPPAYDCDEQVLLDPGPRCRGLGVARRDGRRRHREGAAGADRRGHLRIAGRRPGASDPHVDWQTCLQ
ncbi:hypothetical protein [Agromyces mangrovi Wang et al. 2018]|uniref:hypothetical protein n=1 Tax=Agromyces mangrovi TaxID=1858653 RepID=UPI0025722EFE|nr:hypothetical protein [Agromyces mangrovi]